MRIGWNSGSAVAWSDGVVHHALQELDLLVQRGRRGWSAAPGPLGEPEVPVLVHVSDGQSRCTAAPDVAQEVLHASLVREPAVVVAVGDGLSANLRDRKRGLTLAVEEPALERLGRPRTMYFSTPMETSFPWADGRRLRP